MYQASVVYDNCVRWIENHLEYFDPRRISEYSDTDLQIKCFTELIYLFNMFMPDDNVFPAESVKRIEEFINEVLAEIDIRSYVLHDMGYFPLMPIVEEYSNYVNIESKRHEIDKLIEYKMDLLVKKLHTESWILNIHWKRLI